MKTDKFAGLFIALLGAVSACAGNPLEAMKRFKDQNDQNVARQKNINLYLKPNSLFVAKDVQEVSPGVMEYSFEPRRYWGNEEMKCKYIFVVAKDTGTLIGWRYNGKPENCQQNR